MSGEREFDRPAEVQIAQTFNVALGIAREAAKQGNVKAYVRTLHAFYDHATEKKNYKEEDAEGWKPLGTRGVWWHEMVRAVASVPNLPLVVLRKAYGYGPGLAHGEVAQHLALSLVYRSLGEEMKFLWSPQLKKNTIHTSDVVGIMWAAAEWAAGLDRQKMEALAGVRLPPTGNDGVKNVPNAIQKEQGGVIVPVFNLVDESDTNQDSMTQVLAEVCDPRYSSSSPRHLGFTDSTGIRDKGRLSRQHFESVGQVKNRDCSGRGERDAHGRMDEYHWQYC